MESTLTLLACYGLAFLIKDAKVPVWSLIRLWLRLRFDLISELLDCYFCIGFHCGYLIFFLKTFWFSDYPEVFESELLGGALLYSLASASFCYAFDYVIQLMEKIIDKMEIEESIKADIKEVAEVIDEPS